MHNMPCIQDIDGHGKDFRVRHPTNNLQSLTVMPSFLERHHEVFLYMSHTFTSISLCRSARRLAVQVAIQASEMHGPFPCSEAL